MSGARSGLAVRNKRIPTSDGQLVRCSVAFDIPTERDHLMMHSILSTDASLHVRDDGPQDAQVLMFLSLIHI